MTGTWSAVREDVAWRGTFVARASGRAFSGMWKADLAGAPEKTFEGMLQCAMEKEVSGTWEGAGRVGEWWLTK
jgi:hypothetical protein